MMRTRTKRTLYFLFSLFLIGLSYVLFHYHDNIPLAQLKEDYADEDSKFIELVGMEVHYRERGTGMPLLLLHGTGASLHTWEKWTEELSQYYRVISLDLPGFGLTGKHFGNNYSIQSYTEFLHSFTQKMALDSFHLAGNSLGGNIAWNYALDYPQQVKKLVLLNASGYPHPERTPPLAFRLAQNPILSKLMLRVTPRSLFKKSLQEVYVNDDLVTDAMIDRYFDLFLRRGNRQAFIDRCNQDFVDRSAEIQQIQQPTLIIWGDQDEWVPVADAARFQEDLPNAQLIIYENTGHLPMEERAEASILDVQRFLQEKHVGQVQNISINE
ncbi:MAG: alpha/beta hydrolase [Bacteroidota bacterium]